MNHEAIEQEPKTLSQIQCDLQSVDELLVSQSSKQEHFSSELIKFIAKLICELRLLSLVRHRMITNRWFKLAQCLQELQFSQMEYCPDYIDPSVLNNYMNLLSHLRSQPKDLANCIYFYSIENPQKIMKFAYSTFLCIFQQGWCQEEDRNLYKTLKELARIQDIHQIILNKIDKPNCLKSPLSSPNHVLSRLEPLASFVSAYLFNGASFSYLQTSFSKMISNLNSLSNLRDFRCSFRCKDGADNIASFQYWKIICENALAFLNSLKSCIELMPTCFCKLFNFIRKTEDGEDKCILLFFEGFINRALDSPSVLGINSWKPELFEWSPTHDIADVFRTKYLSLVSSKYYKSLSNILSSIPEYEQIDILGFIDSLTNTEIKHNFISEAELVSINPNFPKEITITGIDLRYLHKAILFVPKNYVSEKLAKMISVIGDGPKKDEKAYEHFKIVIQRQKKVTDAAKSMSNSRSSSLFTSDNFVKEYTMTKKDSYYEFFCDAISILPSFSSIISNMKFKSTKSFLKHIKLLVKLFVPEDDQIQCNTVLYYAITHENDFHEILMNVQKISNYRNQQIMEFADKNSSLVAQHQRISDSLMHVKTMRSNIQCHILFTISRMIIHTYINQEFTRTMSNSVEFLKDNNSYIQASGNIRNMTNISKKYYVLTSEQEFKISQIFFFHITNHITLRKYLDCNQDVWKKSVIIYKTTEDNFQDILNVLQSKIQSQFYLVEKHLIRAKEILRYIKQNSGLSLSIYYITEVVTLATELKNETNIKEFSPLFLWILVSAKLKHLFLLYKFIDKMILKNDYLNSLVLPNEITCLTVFCSGVFELLDILRNYNKRIVSSW